MRDRRWALLLAASLLRVGCASAPAPQPAAKSDAPPASPAETGAKLGGFWLVTVQRGGQSLDHTLHIALTAGEVVGSITGPDGNSHDVSKIVLKGEKVSFEIPGERMAQRFEGTLTGSSMEGKIKMVRNSRGGSKGQGSGGQSGDDSSGGDTSGNPPADGQSSSGSGGGGRGGHGGRGHGGGRGGSSQDATWKAFKSVEPPPETTPAPAKPSSGAGQAAA